MYDSPRKSGHFFRRNLLHLLEASQEEVRALTNGQIARELLGKGWEIRYRGGNSVCATPSDLDLIVADAPRVRGGAGFPSRYSIATWYSFDDGPPEEQPDPIFDLYDAERGDIAGAFKEAVSAMRGTAPGMSREERILATIACHSAVKLGDKLSYEEMKALIKDWLTSRYPATCPHGRSICYRLEHKDIARKLDRH